MSSVSDIKLIRTDTTLDLSQKAEKRCRKFSSPNRALLASRTRHVGSASLNMHPSSTLHEPTETLTTINLPYHPIANYNHRNTIIIPTCASPQRQREPWCRKQSYNYLNFRPLSRLRSYHRKNTGSRPITEVKSCRATLVLRWVTAWEYVVL